MKALQKRSFKQQFLPCHPKLYRVAFRLMGNAQDAKYESGGINIGEVEYIHPRNGYEELMRVNSEGDKTTIYLKKDKNGKKEFVLLNDEKNEFTVVVITGNLTLQEIQGVMQRNSAFGAIDYLIGEVKCIFSESLRWNDLLLLLKIECFSFLARKEKHSNKQNKQIFYKTFLKYRFIRR